MWILGLGIIESNAVFTKTSGKTDSLGVYYRHANYRREFDLQFISEGHHHFINLQL